MALLCLTFYPDLAVGLRCVFRHVHPAVSLLQEAVELLGQQLFLSLVKGGGFGLDEDLARHLSKLAFGFVAKLTPNGSKLAREVLSKAERKGVILSLFQNVYRFILFTITSWQALLIYTHAIDHNLASSTGIAPDTVGKLWLAGSPE